MCPNFLKFVICTACEVSEIMETFQNRVIYSSLFFFPAGISFANFLPEIPPAPCASPRYSLSLSLFPAAPVPLVSPISKWTCKFQPVRFAKDKASLYLEPIQFFW